MRRKSLKNHKYFICAVLQKIKKIVRPPKRNGWNGRYASAHSGWFADNYFWIAGDLFQNCFFRS